MAKKWIILFLFFGIVVIVLGIALVSAFPPEREGNLVDYIPIEAEFWFWHEKRAAEPETSAILQLLGLDPNIAPILDKNRDEVVIYRTADNWYRLDEENLNQESPVQKIRPWNELYERDNTAVVGFLDEDYVVNQIYNTVPIIPPHSYSFTLVPEENAIAFSLFPESYDFKKKRPSGLREKGEREAIDPRIVFALYSRESAVVSRVLEIFKKGVVELVSFWNPVVITGELPDGTLLTEKVVKPELFTWKPVLGSAFPDDQTGGPPIEDSGYRLALDELIIEQYTLEDQVQDIVLPDITYYASDTIFALSFGKQALNPFSGEGSLQSRLYINLALEDPFPIVDIVGKTKALDWLQDLSVQSIMIEEGEDDDIYGALQF